MVPLLILKNALLPVCKSVNHVSFVCVYECLCDGAFTGYCVQNLRVLCGDNCNVMFSSVGNGTHFTRGFTV